MPTSVIDRPLNGDNEKDLFDIDGYQRALVEFIKGAEAPLTIALQGEWGRMPGTGDRRKRHHPRRQRQPLQSPS